MTLKVINFIVSNALVFLSWLFAAFVFMYGAGVFDVIQFLPETFGVFHLTFFFIAAGFFSGNTAITTIMMHSIVGWLPNSLYDTSRKLFDTETNIALSPYVLIIVRVIVILTAWLSFFVLSFII